MTQYLCFVSWAGSGRVGSGRVGSGRVDPPGLTRPKNSPAILVPYHNVPGGGFLYRGLLRCLFFGGVIFCADDIG